MQKRKLKEVIFALNSSAFVKLCEWIQWYKNLIAVASSATTSDNKIYKQSIEFLFIWP